MKKNSIIITHFVGDGGNFLINALSMSKYVGHPFLHSKNGRVGHFFDNTQRNINNEKYCIDVSMWSGNISANGQDPDKVDIKDFHESKSSRLSGFYDSKHYIFKQHYPLWNLKNIDITPDKTDDVDVIITSLVKLFKDVSTKTNCFNVLFINSSIFIALRHYFISGYSSTCFYPWETPGKFYDLKNADVYEELNSITIKEYQQFSKDKREKIERKYSIGYDEILSLFNKNYNKLDEYYNLFLNKTSFLWDVNWYLTEDDTTNNIKKLYEILGFDDYDDSLIREMYQHWIESLTLPVSKWREYDLDKTINLDKLVASNERRF